MDIKDSWKPSLPLPLSASGIFRAFLLVAQRLSPHELPVNNIGYEPAHVKQNYWPQGGSDFSIAFVLRGSGKFRIFRKNWVITAPCVFTTWPGESVRFGPDGQWEEFYIGYDTRLMPILTKLRIACRDRPVWPIANPAGIRNQILELCRHLGDLRVLGRADRIDRLCDLLITDALIAHETHLIPDNSERIIREIERHIHANLALSFDFAELARRHGLSAPHFRRLWKRFFAIPPAHYVLHLRMQEACRLLLETDERINEIAGRLGFNDTLYFSRQFHRLIGRTASAYRKTQQRRGNRI